MSDNQTKVAATVVHQRSVRLIDCSSEDGIELGFRMASALGELRTLLYRINELPQRRLVSESVNHRQDGPDGCHNDKKNKQCLPCGGRESECVLEAAGAEGRDESGEKRNGSNPSLMTADAVKMIAQAEFEPVLGDDDNILIKVRMNLHLLDIIRREGFRKLRLWSVGDLTHCYLHSSSLRVEQSQQANQERLKHEE